METINTNLKELKVRGFIKKIIINEDRSILMIEYNDTIFDEEDKVLFLNSKPQPLSKWAKQKFTYKINNDLLYQLFKKRESILFIFANDDKDIKEIKSIELCNE